MAATAGNRDEACRPTLQLKQRQRLQCPRGQPLVWNARRQLIDWLEASYAKDSDRVDLLYAILNCQGWIRSDARSVVVRLEPLQQPARRAAQEQLCRKLTGLGARIAGGKWLLIEVGDSPL